MTFRATLKKRTSNHECAGVVMFDYPASEYDAVSTVAKMVNQVLFVTVMSEPEYVALQDLTHHAKEPTPTDQGED